MNGTIAGYSQLSVIQQLILTLAALVLVSSFALLAQSRVVATIKMFALQGMLLVLITILVALNSGHYHLLFSAGLTFLLKVWFIPWLLTRQARQLGILRDVDTVVRPGMLLMLAGALVIFCYSVAQPIESFSQSITRDAIAISIAVVMLSLLMLVTRHKAITQVVGFMALENGLFFSAITATEGMPMIVELGVAFDVLIAAVVFGIFFFQMRDSIDSFDIDQLNRLTEVDE